MDQYEYNPVERIKNKFSPFLTLPAMIHMGADQRMIDDAVETCLDMTPHIQTHMAELDDIWQTKHIAAFIQWANKKGYVLDKSGQWSQPDSFSCSFTATSELLTRYNEETKPKKAHEY